MRGWTDDPAMDAFRYDSDLADEEEENEDEWSIWDDVALDDYKDREGYFHVQR